MCIAYLALNCHPDWPVFIAANRDEFHQRPTRSAAPWPDAPHVVGGLDLQAGGSWLAASHDGRYALVTNYREPGRQQPHAPSRGDLVRNFLTGTLTALQYMQALVQLADTYNGFNLIVGQPGQAFYLGNRAQPCEPVALAPGRYVLSNHLLDTPWPKAQRLRHALASYPQRNPVTHVNDIFHALKDTTQADDATLPETGLPSDRERLLSSPFIISPGYGTRCSTLLAHHASGHGFLAETRYSPQGSPVEHNEWPWQTTHGPDAGFQ
jgi:uncharacterized protein with NRDE domain